MATAGPKPDILETSVLINFLKVDQVDLLARLPGQEFLITDHVRDEITQHYPQQVARLTAALQQGHLHEIQVTDRWKPARLPGAPFHDHRKSFGKSTVIRHPTSHR